MPRRNRRPDSRRGHRSRRGPGPERTVDKPPPPGRTLWDVDPPLSRPTAATDGAATNVDDNDNRPGGWGGTRTVGTEPYGCCPKRSAWDLGPSSHDPEPGEWVPIGDFTDLRAVAVDD